MNWLHDIALVFTGGLVSISTALVLVLNDRIRKRKTLGWLIFEDLFAHSRRVGSPLASDQRQFLVRLEKALSRYSVHRPENREVEVFDGSVYQVVCANYDVIPARAVGPILAAYHELSRVSRSPEPARGLVGNWLTVSVCAQAAIARHMLSNRKLATELSNIHRDSVELNNGYVQKLDAFQDDLDRIDRQRADEGSSNR